MIWALLWLALVAVVLLVLRTGAQIDAARYRALERQIGDQR